MKFTVEVEDFYLEEDGLSSGLIAMVTRDVLYQIQNSIKEKVDNEITKNVKLQTEQNLSQKIDTITSLTIATGKIKTRSGGQEVSIEDYIKSLFENSTGYASPEAQIKKLAIQFGNEMKARYDLLFASQLVAKMKEAGLLKDDVAAKLLN